MTFGRYLQPGSSSIGLDVATLQPAPANRRQELVDPAQAISRLHWRHRMNLPDAPIARDGFYVTHLFTVSDQKKSQDFYVRILGGIVIKPENPCYVKLENS